MQESQVTTAATRPHFLSLIDQDHAEFWQKTGDPAYRQKQVKEWLTEKNAISPEQMSNLSKKTREALTTEFDWVLPQIEQRVDSEDGVSKLLLRSTKNQMIECVILRYEKRTVLCVSSQVGCRMACGFCQTGKLGFFRNLTAEEILAQYVVSRQITDKEERRISHVVFMGMGEPLDNYEASVRAANILIDRFGLSARHVTISTSGIAPKIHSLATDSRAALAISLHAAREGLRTELMPINRKYDLAELKKAMLFYQKNTGKKITIEYILIKDKNCSRQDAKELVSYLHGLRAKVNLIPFNPHPGLPFNRPTETEIRNFQVYLAERNFPAPVRYSKGLDVSAACGQLAAKQQHALKDIPSRKNVVAASVPASSPMPL